MKNRLIVMLITVIFVFIAAGCSPNSSQKSVVVASKPHTEQYVLAELITQLIEGNSDIKVVQKLGIGGGTANIQPAILKGEIDIYPEYTGTGWLYVLKEKPESDSGKLYEELKSKYIEQYNMKWLGLYGFNDTYALAVKKSVADKYNLVTYSDLAKVSENLVFCAEADFYEREDGFKGLEKTYNYHFKDKKEIDIGLKYEAIDSGQVDVINAFSTDGLLKKYDLKVLKDDKNFFPSYFAATVVRNDTLKKYPELEKILGRLDGKISEEEMIEMNYAVEKDKKDPKEVAKAFLVKKGLK
ncbi:glycine betaine ABC transporter substrate-binding protein [Pelosinus sp. IPA-1]|uniref:glycine betaine ABC transporter substrate-binding protein n=1 Tax=Pelosinus sp. IPA-1 TaxID=3029569 RepID=UPI0024361CBB|nr:glycine betaine ABC transporter substrate-binding protein [Pelosinus sp. IPA-1]GMB00366.1 hypothetical protein PIPA1_31650 [Pelosinus sp. IPA-1]